MCMQKGMLNNSFNAAVWPVDSFSMQKCRFSHIANGEHTLETNTHEFT